MLADALRAAAVALGHPKARKLAKGLPLVWMAVMRLGMALRRPRALPASPKATRSKRPTRMRRRDRGDGTWDGLVWSFQ